MQKEKGRRVLQETIQVAESTKELINLDRPGYLPGYRVLGALFKSLFPDLVLATEGQALLVYSL